MPDEKEPKQKKDSPKKPASDDFEKTVLDIDIRKIDAVPDETIMTRVPKKEKREDSDLHDQKLFDQEEATTFFDTSKEISEEESSKVRKTKSLPPTAKPSEKIPEKKIEVSRPPKSLPPESSYQPAPRPERSLIFTILGLVLVIALAEGLVEVMRQGAALRLPTIVATIIAVLIWVGMVLRRWTGQNGFLWMMVTWFGLISYAGFQFYTSDADSLHFFKFSLNTLMGSILCLVGAVLTLTFLREKRLAYFVKLLVSFAWALLLLAFASVLFSGRTLEGGLWGPALWRGTPLFLRPAVLALSLAFPLYVLAVLIAMGSGRSIRKGMIRGLGLPLILLSLFGTLLGARLLMRQGVQVPLWGRFASEDYFGATLLDPLTSSVRLQIAKGKQSTSPDRDLHLEVAASNSVEKGRARQSWLMVRNTEGRTFAADLDKYIVIGRGDKKISGAKIVLDRTRLGRKRNIAVVVSMSSLTDSQVKTGLASALYRLASNLGDQDRLLLISPMGVQTLLSSSREEWKSKVDKALVSEVGQAADFFNNALQNLTKMDGIKQIVFVNDPSLLPNPDLRKSFTVEAQKNQVGLSFLALGNPTTPEEDVYWAQGPASLGFELLSASAEALGDFSITFPSFASLPKINLNKDASGQILLQGGKIDFRILTQDPSQISSLTLKIDDDKPIDLDPRLLSQSVDLVRMKVKPGLHHFILSLKTQAGDEVSESFETKYVIREALKFIKPLDKDSVAGIFNVMFSVGNVPGLGVNSIDLSVDGVKLGTATTAPYLIPLDSTTLSEGEHALQAFQTYSDGSTDMAQIQITVNQKLPQIRIVRPSIGEYLSNLAEIEAEVGGGLFQQVQKVEFLVDGEWIGESLQAPFRFLWSNVSYPAGKYFIQTRAHLNSQAMTTDAVQIQLGQGEVVIQADPSLSATGRLFPENVEVLVDSSLSMNVPIGSSVKLDLAKYALSELIQALPEKTHLEVRTYGGGSEARQMNCGDSTLLKNASRQWDHLEAKGTSPLAYALEFLGKDLKKSNGSRVGLLITDGWDRCGVDPIEVAQRLAKQGERIPLHIIYFGDVDPVTESLLKKLAEVMGGRIYKVRGQEEIKEALHDAIQVSFSLYDYKNTPVAEQPLSQNLFTIRSGEYRLDIDTSPPLEKDKVVIGTGSRKTFTVLSREGKYELREE